MNKSLLIHYLLSANTITTSSVDMYFNNVDLYLPLDYTLNSKGKPAYSDYSPKQRQVKYIKGTSGLSEIQFIDNNPSSYPNIETVPGISSNSFLYIPNKYNHTNRIAEYNSSIYLSNIKSTYLSIPLNGVNTCSFGTGNFTIELSFFADSVALPWTYQVLLSYSTPLLFRNTVTNNPASLKSTFSLHSSSTNSYCIAIKNDSLVYIDSSGEYIIKSNISKDTWYHIAIQRNQGKLEGFVNFTKVVTIDNHTTNYSPSISTNEDTFNKRYNIGALHNWVTNTSGQNISYLPLYNHVEHSFSGGISNIRITNQVARYTQDIYSASLPFKYSLVNNKVDEYYDDVLANYPFTYDLYDYSKYHKHLDNKALLVKSPNIDTNFLYLDGTTSFKYEQIPTNIDENEWTFEFYYTYFLNTSPYIASTTGYSNLKPGSTPELTPKDLLNNYVLVSNYSENTNNPKLDETINIVNITSNNKKVLQINIRWLIESIIDLVGREGTNRGNYIGLRASSDGNNWDNIGTLSTWYVGTSIPATDLILYKSDSNNTTNFIKSGYADTATHIAIQKYQDNLYVLVNGVLATTLEFPVTLYKEINKTEIAVSDNEFTTIPLKINNENIFASIGIKGLRFTNKARYFINININEYSAYHNTYNLATSTLNLNPPRARILGIVKTTTALSVSASIVTWTVYITQAVDTLTLDDFTLTQLEGISESEITTLVKISNLEYRVTATTGIGNGKLSLNFIDRKTLYYKDTTAYISNYVGELSFEGDAYIINKTAPIPFLTSGSNPYINSNFTVDVTFDSAINQFNPSYIGIVNGTIIKSEILSQIDAKYRITVEPIKQEAVIVQALEGTGITDGTIISTKSNPLTRIFSESFPILQLPLDISNSYYDLSPSRVELEEITSGNTIYSTDIAPFGASSSLYVSPNLEQSGFKKYNFNSVASTTEINNIDWTIEFFLRIDSSSNKKSHIFSIDNESKGLCFYADNGKLRIVRSMNNIADVFSSLNWNSVDTQYYNWSDTSKTLMQKYPHFAISKQNNIYRLYINGSRIQLIESNVNIDITKGNIYLGYYSPRVSDTPYYLSNLRVTLGKCLYSSATINIPSLPYTVLPNITDVVELLSYISIYSNNTSVNRAVVGDKIILKFISILPLENLPEVIINGVSADVIQSEYNSYTASVTIDNTFTEGTVSFSISIQDEVNIPDKEFNSTTNNSYVFIDLHPLTANIYTEVINNDDYIIEAYIEFSKEIKEQFSASLLTVNNCICSNLYKINSTKYRFSIKAVNSGDFSVYLEANKIRDVVNNFNLESNYLNRAAVIPSYIPDVYWNNVILLIQSDTNILDESESNTELTIVDCDLVSDTSPVGVNKAIRLNGVTSYIRFLLTNQLIKTIDYTIEMYIYITKSTTIKLSNPILYPANEVTNSSFNLEWENIDEATNYSVDISLLSNFNSYIGSFKAYITDINTLSIGNSFNIDIPKISNKRFIGKNGFALSILKETYDYSGYILDVSLDNLFTKKLYTYTNKYIDTRTIKLGDISQVVEDIIDTESPSIPSFTTTKGNIITGLFTQETGSKLIYLLDESTVRLYKEESYEYPAIIEDIELREWIHLAISNKDGYSYLYRNGELEDKVKSSNWQDDYINIGYYLGHLEAYIAGIRVTEGISRYNEEFTPPVLPYSKN